MLTWLKEHEIRGDIARRYDLKTPYPMLYGCSFEVARDMLIRDRDEDLLKLIMEKYKALEGECDLIVCAGSTNR